MIDFTFKDNCDTKQLDIQDASTEYGYQKAVLVIEELGLKKELSQATDPRLIDFFNPSLNTKISFDVAYDGLYKIDYYLFNSVEAVLYEIGSNIIAAPNIYDSFSDFNYIYLDDIYEIDKTMSTPHALFLKRPVQNSFQIAYKGRLVSKYADYLCNTKLRVTKEVLNLKCTDCIKEQSKLNKSLIQLEIVKSPSATVQEKKDIIGELLATYGTARC